MTAVSVMTLLNPQDDAPQGRTEITRFCPAMLAGTYYTMMSLTAASDAGLPVYGDRIITAMTHTPMTKTKMTSVTTAEQFSAPKPARAADFGCVALVHDGRNGWW